MTRFGLGSKRLINFSKTFTLSTLQNTTRKTNSIKMTRQVIIWNK